MITNLEEKKDRHQTQTKLVVLSSFDYTFSIQKHQATVKFEILDSHILSATKEKIINNTQI